MEATIVLAHPIFSSELNKAYGNNDIFIVNNPEDLSMDELMYADIKQMRKATDEELSLIRDKYQAESVLVFKEDREALTDRFHYLSAVTNMYLRPALMLLRVFGINKKESITFEDLMIKKSAKKNDVLVKITLKNQD